MLTFPPRLKELIEKDHALNAFVVATAATIQPWVSDNKTVFFPEYTDHSVTHLNEVLATAESLIANDAWPLLTPTDAAVLITAVLLHDCALHLSEDGFFSLVNSNQGAPRSQYVDDDRPWSQLWVEFEAEAKRFDQHKLQSLFGDAEPVRAVAKNKILLTLRDRLLIGEFLRRHHARLAHEIALEGVPGVGGARVKIGATHADILDLSGFVARSHNMSLRAAVDALDADVPGFQLNCHVSFVMAVLRIADYIQIHASRAPHEALKFKGLASPVSRLEWKKHAALVSLHRAHKDPESIFAEVNPKDVKAFLSLRVLFKDIQAELDQIWAVLGETYGQHKQLRNLGITIRRIRSSIDKPDEFSRKKKPDYIPRAFGFRAASSELMNLLIAPLYGDSPEIGIRELVQNAVDACLERDDMIAKGIVPANSAADGDVVVTLLKADDGATSLIVEDWGVGMTIGTIDKYFLNIGASFRGSDLWRKNHEVNGQSSVNRTGRFGIGLLAAFLLGDKLKVTTRHISGDVNSGVSFECRRGDESIELRPCEHHGGTRIQIEIREAVYLRLLRGSFEFMMGEPASINCREWDWYCLPSPRVVRQVREKGESRVIEQGHNVPRSGATLHYAEWCRISTPDFADVLWSYVPRSSYTRDAFLVCNGIFVGFTKQTWVPKLSPELGVITISCPTIAVFDPNGNFPLNLKRDNLTTKNAPFERELAKSIALHLALDFIATFQNHAAGFSVENVIRAQNPDTKCLNPSNRGPQLAPLLLTKDGVIPTDLALIWRSKPNSLLVDARLRRSVVGVCSSRKLISVVGACISCNVGDDEIHNDSHYSSQDQFVDNVFENPVALRSSSYYYAEASNETALVKLIESIPVGGRRIYLRKKYKSPSVAYQLSDYIPPLEEFDPEMEDETWAVWTQGDPPPLEIDSDTLFAELSTVDSFGFVTLYLDWEMESDLKAPEADSIFASAWLSRVGGPVLRLKKD